MAVLHRYYNFFRRNWISITAVWKDFDICRRVRSAPFVLIFIGVLASVFFLPFNTFFISFLNGALIALSGAFLLCLTTGRLAFRPIPFLFPVLMLLLLLGFVSLLFNGLWIDGLIGDTFTPTTLLALISFCVIAAVGGSISFSKRNVYRACIIASFASALVTIFLWWKVFVTNIENLSFVSLFLALSIFLGISILCSFGKHYRAPLFWAAVIMCYGGVLWISLFPQISIVLVTFALLLCTGFWAWRQHTQCRGHVIALFVIGVSTVTANIFVHPSFLPEREPLPAVIAHHVIHPSFSESAVKPFVGNGPGTITYTWNVFRTTELNNSPYWNARPNITGIGLFDIMLTYGVLGTVLVLLGVVAVWRRMSQALYELDNRDSPRSLFVERTLIFVCISATTFSVFGPLYTPFIILSLLTGCVWLGMYTEKKTVLPYILSFKNILRPIGLIGGILLIISGIGYAVTTSTAHADFTDGAYYLLPAFPHDESARRISNQYLHAFLSGNPQLTPQGSKEQLQRSISAIDKAVALNPHDMETRLREGALYVELHEDGVGGATAEKARAAFKEAKYIAPSHPFPRFLLGQAEFLLNSRNVTNAARWVKRAAESRKTSKEMKQLFIKFMEEAQKKQ